MGSDDDMFRIWSGPEGSSHKEPLSGIRIHRAHGHFFARFYQTAQCSTLRATQGDNLSFKRQGMTRRSMPCLFHANLFALGVARWRCQNIDGYAVQEAAGRLVSRWSSASPAGSLDYQAPCRHSRVANQNRPKGHIYLNYLIPCLLLLVGVVWALMATWFKRRRCCCLNYCS